MPISDFVLDLSGSLQPTRIPVSWNTNIDTGKALNSTTPFKVSIFTHPQDSANTSNTYFLNSYEVSQDIYNVYHAIIQYSDSSRNPILPNTTYYIRIREFFDDSNSGVPSEFPTITTPLKASYDSLVLPDSGGSSFTYTDNGVTYKVHVFDGDANIVVPANPIASVVTAYVIGAGGNGANGGGDNSLGGGGGSGGYFIQAPQGILPNTNINISFSSLPGASIVNFDSSQNILGLIYTANKGIDSTNEFGANIPGDTANLSTGGSSDGPNPDEHAPENGLKYPTPAGNGYTLTFGVNLYKVCAGGGAGGDADVMAYTANSGGAGGGGGGAGGNFFAGGGGGSSASGGGGGGGGSDNNKKGDDGIEGTETSGGGGGGDGVFGGGGGGGGDGVGSSQVGLGGVGGPGAVFIVYRLVDIDTKPSTPEIISATAITESNSINVVWTYAGPPLSQIFPYQVYFYQSDSSSSVILSSYAIANADVNPFLEELNNFTTSLSFRDSSNNPFVTGQTYYFTLEAASDTEQSFRSSPIQSVTFNSTTPPPPSDPTGLSAITLDIQATRIPIRWTYTELELNTLGATPFQVNMYANLLAESAISSSYFLNSYEVSAPDASGFCHALIQYADSSRNPLLANTQYFFDLNAYDGTKLSENATSRISATTKKYSEKATTSFTGPNESETFTYADSSGIIYKVHKLTESGVLSIPPDPTASVIEMWIVGPGGNGSGSTELNAGGAGGQVIVTKQAILPSDNIIIDINSSRTLVNCQHADWQNSSGYVAYKGADANGATPGTPWDASGMGGSVVNDTDNGTITGIAPGVGITLDFGTGHLYSVSAGGGYGSGDTDGGQGAVPAVTGSNGGGLGGALGGNADSRGGGGGGGQVQSIGGNGTLGGGGGGGGGSGDGSGGADAGGSGGLGCVFIRYRTTAPVGVVASKEDTTSTKVALRSSNITEAQFTTAEPAVRVNIRRGSGNYTDFSVQTPSVDSNNNYVFNIDSSNTPIDPLSRYSLYLNLNGDANDNYGYQIISDPSDIVNVLTAPANFTYNSSGVTATTIPLNWSNSDGNATGFNVYYSSANSSGTITNASGTSYNLTGLQANTEYSIQLEGIVSGEESARAGPLTVRTAQATSSGLPTPESFEEVTGSATYYSLSVTWVYDSSNNSITGFKISYNDVVVTISNPSARSATLTGLEPDIDYQNITIIAYNGSTESDPTDPISPAPRTSKIPRPIGLAKVSTETHAITVSWIYDATSNVASTFDITVNGGEGDTIFSDIPGTATYYRLDDSLTNSSNIVIDPGVLYSVTIKAKHFLGTTSDPSDVFQISTLPLSPISLVEVDGTAETNSITLSWDHYYFANSFTVYYTNSSGVSLGSTTFQKEPGINVKQITDLLPGRSYIFRMRAIANGEQSALSDPSQLISTKPAAPTNLVEIANTATTTSLRVQWQYPNDTNITGFKITYTFTLNGSENTLEIPNISPNTTNSMISNLEESTVYSISILAYIGDLESDSSDPPLSIATKPPKPDALQDATQDTPLTHPVVILYWGQSTPPYKLYYQSTNSSGVVTDIPQNTYNISQDSNFLFGKKYTFSVTVTTNDRESDQSDPLDIIMPPGNFSFITSTPTTATISWDTPNDYTSLSLIITDGITIQSITTPPPYTIPNLEPATAYQGSLIGNISSVSSSDVPLYFITAPDNFTLQHKTDTTLAVYWDSPGTSGMDYTLYLNDSPLSENIITSSEIIENLTANTLYTISLSVRYNTAESGDSPNYITSGRVYLPPVRTLANSPATLIQDPDNPPTHNSISVSWDSSYNAINSNDSYTLYYKTGAQISYSNSVRGIPPGNTSMVITGLTAGIAYNIYLVGVFNGVERDKVGNTLNVQTASSVVGSSTFGWEANDGVTLFKYPDSSGILKTAYLITSTDSSGLTVPSGTNISTISVYAVGEGASGAIIGGDGGGGGQIFRYENKPIFGNIKLTKEGGINTILIDSSGYDVYDASNYLGGGHDASSNPLYRAGGNGGRNNKISAPVPAQSGFMVDLNTRKFPLGYGGGYGYNSSGTFGGRGGDGGGIVDSGYLGDSSGNPGAGGDGIYGGGGGAGGWPVDSSNNNGFYGSGGANFVIVLLSPTASSGLVEPTGITQDNVPATPYTIFVKWYYIQADESSITGFKVMYNGNVLTLNKKTDRTRTLTGLTPNTTYAISVTAYNDSNQSTPTEELFVTTPKIARPTNLSEVDTTTTSITIGWVYNESYTPASFDIQLNSADDTLLITKNGDLVEAELTDLQPGIQYDIQMTATDSSGSSSNASDSIQVATLPEAPVDLDKMSETTTSITLTWTHDSMAENFTVYYTNSSGDSSGSQTFAKDESINYEEITGLLPSTSYIFTMRAIANTKESALSTPSEPLSTESSTSTIPAPTNLEVDPASNILANQIPFQYQLNSSGELFDSSGNVSFPTGWLVPIRWNYDSSAFLLLSPTEPFRVNRYDSSGIYENSLLINSSGITLDSSGYHARVNAELTGDTTYYISLNAHNNGDISDESNLIQVTTNSLRARNLIVDPAYSVSATEIPIQWQYDHALFSFYNLFLPVSIFEVIFFNSSGTIIENSYRLNSSGITVDSSGYHAKIKYRDSSNNALLPATTYYIKFNTGIDSEPENQLYSNLLQATTRPVAPTNLAEVANTATNNSLTLSWQYTKNPNLFTINYTNGDSSGSVNSSGTLRQRVVTGLQVGRQYTFTISATVSGVKSVDSSNVVIATLPVAPDNLSEISKTSTTITLGWAHITNAENFVVYYTNSSGDSSGSTAPFPKTGGASKTITDLLPSTSYIFTMRAFANTKESALSDASPAISTESSTSTIVAPTNLAEVANTATNNSLTLSWQYTNNPNLFTINYTNGDSSGSVNASGTLRQRVITGLDQARQYTFTISATVSGVKSVDSSNVVIATLPDAPIGLADDSAGGNIGTAYNKLAWNDPDVTYTNFILYYESSDSSGTVDNISGNFYTLPTEVFTLGKQYTFTVSVIANGRESAKSSPIELLMRPGNFRFVSGTPTSVTVAWDTQNDYESLSLLYRKQGTPEETVITDITTSPYTLSGLEPNLLYTLFISGVNSAGGVSVYTDPITMVSPPTDLLRDASGTVTGTRIPITWVPGAGTATSGQDYMVTFYINDLSTQAMSSYLLNSYEITSDSSGNRYANLISSDSSGTPLFPNTAYYFRIKANGPTTLSQESPGIYQGTVGLLDQQTDDIFDATTFTDSTFTYYDASSNVAYKVIKYSNFENSILASSNYTASIGTLYFASPGGAGAINSSGGGGGAGGEFLDPSVPLMNGLLIGKTGNNVSIKDLSDNWIYISRVGQDATGIIGGVNEWDFSGYTNGGDSNTDGAPGTTVQLGPYTYSFGAGGGGASVGDGGGVGGGGQDASGNGIPASEYGGGGGGGILGSAPGQLGGGYGGALQPSENENSYNIIPTIFIRYITSAPLGISRGIVTPTSITISWLPYNVVETVDRYIINLGEATSQGGGGDAVPDNGGGVPIESYRVNENNYTTFTLSPFSVDASNILVDTSGNNTYTINQDASGNPLVPGTEYYIYIQASIPGGGGNITSDYSDIITATTESITIDPPTNLIVDPASEILAWKIPVRWQYDSSGFSELSQTTPFQANICNSSGIIQSSYFLDLAGITIDSAGYHADIEYRNSSGQPLLPNTTYYITLRAYGSSTFSVQSNLLQARTANTNNAICFLRGTKILCLTEGLKEQYIEIEQIRPGAIVKTLNKSYVKVQHIGKMMFENPDHSNRCLKRLYRLPKRNYPELKEDLIITGNHSILVDTLSKEEEKMTIELAKRIYVTTDKYRLMAHVDQRSEPYVNPGLHEVWHLALENDNYICNYGVYANGLPAETCSLRMITEYSGMELQR